MKSKKYILGIALVSSALGLMGCTDQDSADFPSDTVEIVVPYSAGGSTDLSMRRLAEIAEDTCGTTFIVSNQTGGAGTVGVTAALTSSPDGYTIGATAADLIIPHQLGMTEISMDQARGVLRYALNDRTVLAHVDTEYDSIQDVIDAASDGDVINVATPGNGSEVHLSTVGMALDQGVLEQFNFLPFDGDATALEAVAGGQADVSVIVEGTALPQVEAGNVRALATLSEEPSELMPDVPTAIEDGIDWVEPAPQGIVVPIDTPDEIVGKLDECLSSAIDTQEFNETMSNQNLSVGYLPAQEFEEYMLELENYYGDIIERSGMTSE